MKILGHRGIYTNDGYKGDFVENTLPALQNAFDEGADGVEFDIFLTKDKIPVLITYNDLSNSVEDLPANKRLVSDYTLEELKNLKLKNDNTIPTLDEALDLIANHKKETGKDPVIYFDLKGDDCVNSTYQCLSNYTNTEKLNLKSMLFGCQDFDKLQEMKRLEPEAQITATVSTETLFGKENVDVENNFSIKPNAKYDPETMEKLAKLAGEYGIHAVGLVVYSIRPELIQFCIKHQIGLVTSATNPMLQEEIEPGLSQVIKGQLSPTFFICNKADKGRKIVEEIEDGIKRHPRQGFVPKAKTSRKSRPDT